MQPECTLLISSRGFGPEPTVSSCQDRAQSAIVPATTDAEAFPHRPEAVVEHKASLDM